MPADVSPLWISLKTAGLATIITFFLGIAAAYGMLGYRGRWKSMIEGVLLSPLILPPTVVGFLLLWLFGRQGPLGSLTRSLAFSVVFTWPAAVITATVVSFPLMYKTALGAFEQIDQSLLSVASTLGASEGRIFWRVLLPLAVPGILAGTTLTFARALGEFGATLMLAGNIPGQTQTIPMAIYFAVEAGALNEAWVWVLVILLISLSGIIVGNLWQAQYDSRVQRDQASAAAAGEPVKRHSQRATPVHDRQTTPSEGLETTPGLWVNIQKQLMNFELDIALSAHSASLGILGSSGSGKSMLLRCIAGVETPTAGKIVLNGQVLFDAERGIHRPSHQRNVSLVFQNYALFPHLTIAQNIAFGLHHLPKPLRSQRVEQQLVLVQLQSLGNRYPHQLSGGQQQRAALARALATEPEALLLDEPFSALDTHLRSQMERQLVEILSTYQGVTLLVTHNLEEAYRLCETLLVMSGGKAIACDTKHQIFEHPKNVRVAQMTGCQNISRAVVQQANQIEAIDWGITLNGVEAIPHNLSAIGIRAHHLAITPRPSQENAYPCWLTSTSETPHQITLFLKFNAAPTSLHDYHIQTELFKEHWRTIQDQPLPWYAQLSPSRLVLMTGEALR